MHASVDSVVNVQVKRVPEAWHEVLRERAAARGISLNDLLLEILERETSLPTLEEWNAKVAVLAERMSVSDETLVLIDSKEFWDEVKGR